MSERTSASPGPSAAASSMCRRGTTSTCTGAWGLRSRNAMECSVLSTTSAGMSPATMRQNTQSAVSFTDGGPVLRRLGAARGRRALHLGVQVLEAAGRDAAVLDEGVHVVGLEPDHPAELEGGQGSLVDEAIEAAQGHPEVLGRLF